MEASRDGQAFGRAITTFDWLEGGAFLIQHADIAPDQPPLPDELAAHSPFPIVNIIGLDESTEQFCMLYADGRGVFRVCQLTLLNGVWKIWRDSPGFFQRFFGSFSDDRHAITGRWEISEDGSQWDSDFDVTYRKAG